MLPMGLSMTFDYDEEKAAFWLCVLFLVAVLASCSSSGKKGGAKSTPSSHRVEELQDAKEVRKPDRNPTEKTETRPKPESDEETKEALKVPRDVALGWYHVKGCGPKNPKFRHKLEAGEYESLTFSFGYKLTRHIPGGKRKRSIIWLTLDGRHRDLLAKVMLTDLGERQRITVRHGMHLAHANKPKLVHETVMPPGEYGVALHFDFDKGVVQMDIATDGHHALSAEWKTQDKLSLSKPADLVWDHGHATEGLGPNEICVDGTAWTRPEIEVGKL